jgi:hypothetical protein
MDSVDAAQTLQLLIATADARSFSLAARALRQTPSAVSKAVTRAAARLGVRLVHRATRRLSVTSQVQAYVTAGAASSRSSRLSSARHLRAASPSAGSGRSRLRPARGSQDPCRAELDPEEHLGRRKVGGTAHGGDEADERRVGEECGRGGRIAGASPGVTRKDHARPPAQRERDVAGATVAMPSFHEGSVPAAQPKIEHARGRGEEEHLNEVGRRAQVRRDARLHESPDGPRLGGSPRPQTQLGSVVARREGGVKADPGSREPAVVGGPLVLLLFARLATVAGAWLDGNLRIDLTAGAGSTGVDVLTTLGFGIAERVFPRFRFAVPLAEFEGAIARVPPMIWPLKLEKREVCITLTATKSVRMSTRPPPDDPHDPVTEPHRARSAIQGLAAGEYADILESIVPVGYHPPGFDVTPSPYTPFAGPHAGKKFLRVTRRNEEDT